MIPGLPDADSAAVWLPCDGASPQRLRCGPLLRGPSLQLEDLLLLGARLDDLLLPWRFDLQLQHRIDHPGLLAHIERVGVALLNSPAAT